MPSVFRSECYRDVVSIRLICRSHQWSDREKEEEEEGEGKKETRRSSEVTEPLDDMRHANSFRRAENFGPRIQAARSRRPNANSGVKQW